MRGLYNRRSPLWPTSLRLSLVGVVAAAALSLMGLGSAQGAIVNKAILSGITVTDTAANTPMYSIQLTNGQIVMSSTYIPDAGNNAQYAGGGYGNGVTIGDGTIDVQSYTDSHSVTHDKSIVMTTTETAPPDGGAPLYFDTAPFYPNTPPPTPNSLRVSFSVDLASNGGVTSNAFNNAAFAANIFANSTSATRFIASPTSSAGGVFGLTKSDGSLFTVGNYNNDTFYNIDVNLNFLTQTATLAINGAESSPIGFRHTFATIPQLTEVFFYQGANAVPEPASLTLWAAGSAIMLILRRRS